MVYDEIVDCLANEYRSGKTYQSIARARGVSFAYVRDLINGRCKARKMALETFFKLFPHAQISLDGSAAVLPQNEADTVSRSQYQDLRDQYQDLRDQYQDLRDQYQELQERLREKSISPCVSHDPPVPYRITDADRRLPFTSFSSDTKNSEKERTQQ